MRAGFYFAGFIRVFCWSTCAAELQQQVGRAGGRLRGGREGSREVAVRYQGERQRSRARNRRREVCQDGVLGLRVRPQIRFAQPDAKPLEAALELSPVELHVELYWSLGQTCM